MKRIATIAAVLTTAAIVAPVAAAGNVAAKPKPKPACQAELVSLGVRGDDPFGLELYTWSVCGRRSGCLS